MTSSDRDRDLLVVVVGAGASFDCLAKGSTDWIKDPLYGGQPLRWEEARPPMTVGLVSDTEFQNRILANYADYGAGGVADELRRSLAKAWTPETLEQTLSKIAARDAHNPRAATSMLAFRFYLRDLYAECSTYARAPMATGGVTNYTELVRASYDWATLNDAEMCFVNFNYDTLLDQACAAEAGLAPGTGIRTEDGRVSVVRPHGAVTWEWKLTDGRLRAGTKITVAQSLLAQGTLPEIDTSRVVVDDRHVTVHADQVGSGVPVMALPLPGKSEATLVWPEEQRKFFRALAGRATKVVTLGWRGMDDHFTPYLAQVARPNCAVLVVTGGPPDNARREVVEIGNRLSSVGAGDFGRSTTAQFYWEGFSQLVSSDYFERFLAQEYVPPS